jgi:uncharacterized protein YjbI with pentapeptide repeats
VPRRPRPLQPPAAPRWEGDAAELDPGGLAGGLAEGRLSGLDLTGGDVRGLKLTDVEVERGELANLVAPEAALRRVTIAGARLTGVRWPRARLEDVAVRGCRIDLATFAGSTFERVAFEDCRLEQADFREALWRSVRFTRCDLSGADLTGLRVDRCVLEACALDGLVAVERLRGAALPWADVLGNAALFAQALGIRVLEEEDDARDPRRDGGT